LQQKASSVKELRVLGFVANVSKLSWVQIATGESWYMLPLIAKLSTSMRLQRNLHNEDFEGNMTMSVVIILWELLRKCQTITFIMNGSEELP
jgi:hypothetical protein